MALSVTTQTICNIAILIILDLILVWLMMVTRACLHNFKIKRNQQFRLTHHKNNKVTLWIWFKDNYLDHFSHMQLEVSSRTQW